MLKRMNWMPVWRKISARGTRGEGLVHDALGVRVAVVARVAQQRAVAAEQGEIDAPGVDADAVDAPHLAAAMRRPCSISLYRRSTSQCSVSSVRDGAVGEAVHHLQREPLAVEPAEDAAAALGAEVEGEDVLGRGHGVVACVRGDRFPIGRCGA